jgi:hypothetical protein
MKANDFSFGNGKFKLSLISLPSLKKEWPIKQKQEYLSR